MNPMKKNKILFISTLIALMWFFAFNKSSVPIENLDLSIGAGYDIIKKHGKVEFSVPVSVYEFGEKDKVTSLVHKNSSRTLGGTRQDRQRRANREFMIGSEKIYLFSEAASRWGLKSISDILFENYLLNNTGLTAVCHGKAYKILTKKIPTYSSAADYIDGMLRVSSTQNFFAPQYNIMDMFIRMDAEGKSIVMPYISIIDNELAINGMALFNKEKMVAKINMKDARAMNVLRENSSFGMFTIYKSPKKYINFQSTVMRKAKCTKKNNKYIFTISLDIKGTVATNTLYPKLYEKPSQVKKFTDDMAKHVEQIEYSFIKKLQKKYKVDCLELGQVAAAKYGRHTGVDWNKVISNSKIIVKAKVSIDRNTRGNY
jgi:Ger(x)C family germination protein